MWRNKRRQAYDYFHPSTILEELKYTKENMALERRKREEEKTKGKCGEGRKSPKDHGKKGIENKLR